MSFATYTLTCTRVLMCMFSMTVLLTLSGCTAVEAAYGNLRDAIFGSPYSAKGKELEQVAPPPPPGYSTVYFYRTGVIPTTNIPDVILAGKMVFRPYEGTYTYAYVRAGWKKFRVQWDEKTRWAPKEIQLEIEQGKIYYLKLTGIYNTAEREGMVGAASGARISLIPGDEKWPLQEMRRCCVRYMSPDFQEIL